MFHDGSYTNQRQVRYGRFGRKGLGDVKPVARAGTVRSGGCVGGSMGNALAIFAVLCTSYSVKVLYSTLVVG